LTSSPPVLPLLVGDTVRHVLGDNPDPQARARIAWDVTNAVRELEREIRSGSIALDVRFIGGRPLGDWLPLDEVARLLRLWSQRPR
jgi:hypothetical protein